MQRILFRSEIYANIAKPVSQEEIVLTLLSLGRMEAYSSLLSVSSMERRGEWIRSRRRAERGTRCYYFLRHRFISTRAEARAWVHYQCCGIFCRALS